MTALQQPLQCPPCHVPGRWRAPLLSRNVPLPLATPARSILSIAALQKGLYTVVATSLIGSILSNLLLVLGEWGGPCNSRFWCSHLHGTTGTQQADPQAGAHAGLIPPCPAAPHPPPCPALAALLAQACASSLEASSTRSSGSGACRFCASAHPRLGSTLATPLPDLRCYHALQSPPSASPCCTLAKKGVCLAPLPGLPSFLRRLPSPNPPCALQHAGQQGVLLAPVPGLHRNHDPIHCKAGLWPSHHHT